MRASCPPISDDGSRPAAAAAAVAHVAHCSYTIRYYVMVTANVVTASRFRRVHNAHTMRPRHGRLRICQVAGRVFRVLFSLSARTRDDLHSVGRVDEFMCREMFPNRNAYYNPATRVFRITIITRGGRGERIRCRFGDVPKSRARAASPRRPRTRFRVLNHSRRTRRTHAPSPCSRRTTIFSVTPSGPRVYFFPKTTVDYVRLHFCFLDSE